ncbi:MAG TPA: hypothetical protein VES60_12765 [Nakamurella sp.]|nr:hypothetical protein [Nakamurella sp.]
MIRPTTSIPTAVIPVGSSGDGPHGLCAGPDGALWLTLVFASGRVGRIDPVGRIDVIDLADRSSRPHAVVVDPDGGCWVTLWGSHQVAHVATDRTIELVDLPPDSEPHGLAFGPDDGLWVALESGALARVDAGRHGRSARQ